MKVKGGRPQKYTDEEMLEAMQQAALRGKLSYNGFKEWRLLQAASGGPTAEAIAIRFGSWKGALAKASLRSPGNPTFGFPFTKKPIDLDPGRFGCRVYSVEEREAYVPAEPPAWAAIQGAPGS